MLAHLKAPAASLADFLFVPCTDLPDNATKTYCLSASRGLRGCICSGCQEPATISPAWPNGPWLPHCVVIAHCSSASLCNDCGPDNVVCDRCEPGASACQRVRQSSTHASHAALCHAGYKGVIQRDTVPTACVPNTTEVESERPGPQDAYRVY